MTKITKEDVQRFYADKFADEEHCPITEKYLSKLKDEETKKNEILEGDCLHGDYVPLINTFKMGSVEKEYKDKKKDEKFYDWLKLREIDSFSFFLPDIFLEHTNYYDVALQKWHLYISYYAYKEFEGKRTTFKFSCSELLLWMCEAAGSTQTERLYEELDSIEENGRDKKQIDEWAKRVRDEIIGIISASKEKI